VTPRDLQWGVHVVRMGKTRNEYGIFVGNLLTKLNLKKRCGDDSNNVI
jgi:hypothetical protein